MLKNGDVVGKSSCNVPCFMLYSKQLLKTRNVDSFQGA